MQTIVEAIADSIMSVPSTPMLLKYKPMTATNGNDRRM